MRRGERHRAGPDEDLGVELPDEEPAQACSPASEDSDDEAWPRGLELRASSDAARTGDGDLELPLGGYEDAAWRTSWLWWRPSGP